MKEDKNKEKNPSQENNLPFFSEESKEENQFNYRCSNFGYEQKIPRWLISEFCTGEEEIEEVYWEDLFPECIWQLRVKNLGPLIVAMSSHNKSIYSEVRDRARQKLSEILIAPTLTF